MNWLGARKETREGNSLCLAGVPPIMFSVHAFRCDIHGGMEGILYGSVAAVRTRNRAMTTPTARSISTAWCT